MDGIHRIMEQGHEPSDDDITRMRSRTTRGVQEYHLVVETGGCHVLVDAFRLHTVVTLSRARDRERMDFLRHRLVMYPRAYAITFDRDIPHDRNSEPHGFHTSWTRARSFSIHQYPYSISSLKKIHVSIVWKIVSRPGLRSANQGSSRRSFPLHLIS